MGGGGAIGMSMGVIRMGAGRGGGAMGMITKGAGEGRWV